MNVCVDCLGCLGIVGFFIACGKLWCVRAYVQRRRRAGRLSKRRIGLAHNRREQLPRLELALLRLYVIGVPSPIVRVVDSFASIPIGLRRDRRRGRMLLAVVGREVRAAALGYVEGYVEPLDRGHR